MIYLSELMVISWLVAFQTADGSVKLTVTYQRITALSTKKFNLTCMYDGKNTEVSSVELFVSKGGGPQEALVSMDSSGKLLILHRSREVYYEGKIQHQSKAYLSATWDRARKGLVGLYICKVNIFNHNGGAQFLTRQINVEEGKATIADAVSAIKELQTSLHKMQTFQDKILPWKKWITLAFKNLEKLTKQAFYSKVFRNKYYIAQNYWPDVAKNAEVICQVRGGYISKVSNFVELKFLGSFLQSYQSQPVHRPYYAMYSGRWNASNPEGDQCLFLDETTNWYPTHKPCQRISKEAGFICEMPKV